MGVCLECESPGISTLSGLSTFETPCTHFMVKKNVSGLSKIIGLLRNCSVILLTRPHLFYSGSKTFSLFWMTGRMRSKSRIYLQKMHTGAY